MKRITFFLLILFSPVLIIAQSFPGYRTGNYSGVYSSFFNPAGLAQNNYKWDISLIGVNAEFGNNNKTFGYKNLKDIIDGNTDIGQLGKTYDIVSAFAGADLTGPSFMISKEKWGLALTTRSRVMVNLTDLDGNLLNSINNTSFNSTPFTLKSAQMQKVVANAWSEFGLSYAKVLHQDEKSVFKFGITGKYIAGSANTWLQVNDLSGTIGRDALSNYFLTNAGGSVSSGYSGFDINNFNAGDLLKMKGTGFGGNIGFTYETKTKNAGKNHKKDIDAPYDIKLGIALTDAGIIKYNAADFADYAMAITASDQWYPADIDGKSINEIRQYLDGSPYFTKTSTAAALKYTVKMPMALDVNADIAMSKDFYTDIAAHINLAGKTDTYSSFTYTAFSITPRIEKKHFSFYFPLTYSTLSDFNAGLSLRLGPVFIGSGSLFTTLLNNSKQADVHVGIHISGLANRKKKTEKEKPQKETVKEEEKIKPDADKDGIPDSEDKCPDVFGLLRYNGCPVPDTDKDGINDEEDSCINLPGLARYHGCPIPDTDKDGIDDENDKCPKLAGTKENNGCPLVKKEIVQKVSSAAKKIYFKTASYELLPESNGELDNIAALLKDNPALHLKVEGHTDNVGSAEKNKVLSQLRADAVKYYILRKGIPADRVTSIGYGEEKPIADNKTVQGRAKNRRVELTVEY